LTIGEVRLSLPWNTSFLDRTSEGLEQAGMRPCPAAYGLFEPSTSDLPQ
jgi:hypothetical protein